jgi:acetoin utilization deacetylase AcuC-like enzyme
VKLPVVWTEAHRGHAPGGGLWLGVPQPADEVPTRVDRLREAALDAGAPLHDAAPHGDEVVTAVHAPELVGFLAGAHDAWVAAGHPDDPGQPDVVPYVFPSPTMRSIRPPATVRADVGRFATDTMTPVGPGTYAAARAAVDAAVTAADLVAGGERAAYAAVRPPGHHAGPAFYGGSCYLNNAACAARRLGGRVAIVDVDAHHGNGTQEVFWDDPDVFFGSVHVDPGRGWFPHYCGFADERGGGTNRNVPVPPGAGDEPWLAALEVVLGDVVDHDPEALVVSLGVDAAAGDPESPLEVTVDGFREAGRRLAEVDRPTVFVQEGGYDLDALAGLVLAVLEGFEDG